MSVGAFSPGTNRDERNAIAAYNNRAQAQAASADLAAQQGLGPGTNPMRGFASQYTPSTAQMVWDSPWAILPNVFKAFGGGGDNARALRAQTGAGYQSLRDIGADPLTLYNIMAGGDQLLSGQMGGGSPEADYINWLNALYKSYGSVGGRAFSGRELLR